MAAQTVNVTYNPQSGTLGFAPNNGNVEVSESGTITFSKPGQQNFAFTGFQAFTATTPPVLSGDFSWTVDASSGNLVVTDSDADAGTYNYCISFTVGGQSGQSDPQIINKS